MRKRTVEAARLEQDYFARVRTALAGREMSEVDEVIQSVTEHIEEELSDDLDSEVPLVQMANVLERLGPPETYGQEESGPEPGEQARVSKLAVVGALGLPAALVAGLLTFALGLMFAPETFRKSVNISFAAVLAGIAVVIAGIILSVCALVTIRKSKGRLR